MEPGLTLSSITAFVCASLERIISSSCSGATVWSKGTQVSSKRSSATCQFETKKREKYEEILMLVCCQITIGFKI